MGRGGEERVRSEKAATALRVSIGLPVYNGEKYLAKTLDSILAQTFRVFELIISDNASTDATEAICRRYAAGDPRIRYLRNAENLGAARNYNRVFQLARGEYFKWSGHDDPPAPTFLARCVEVLDRDPEIVLCFTRIRAIDARGEEHDVGALTARTLAPSLSSARRRPTCASTTRSWRTTPQGAVFGLIRRSVLARTELIGSYRSSDLTLLGELALRGRFHQVPEALQSRRFHPEQGRHVYRTRRLREAWFDPARSQTRSHPYWRLLQEHLASIQRAAPDRRTRSPLLRLHGDLGHQVCLRPRAAKDASRPPLPVREIERRARRGCAPLLTRPWHIARAGAGPARGARVTLRARRLPGCAALRSRSRRAAPGAAHLLLPIARPAGPPVRPPRPCGCP
jgi:Glycosyl transferase family 2